MRAVGLVVEYNPFHNGHLHHLRESLRLAEADVAVAVMSGHFLQRGEPALLDKWHRTRMALENGVDLVLELPFAFACNSAPHFADGAVRSLAGLGGVDALCFGSEAGDLSSLQNIADLLEFHKDEIESGTRQGLKQGKSYPEARQEVLAKHSPDAETFLSQPNNILGLEYLRALRQFETEITPLTARRIGAGFHDTETVRGIASATGIRQRLARGEAVDSLVPAPTAKVLEEALAKETVTPSRYETAILMAIQADREQIAKAYQVGEGMENRLAEIGRSVTRLTDAVDGLKSRQLTQTRVQRMLLYQLLGVGAEEMPCLLEQGPLYLRLLGARQKGQAFLAQNRKKRALPLLTNMSRAYPQLKKFYGRGSRDYHLAEKMLDQDLKATRVYQLLKRDTGTGPLNRDFHMDPIRH